MEIDNNVLGTDLVWLFAGVAFVSLVIRFFYARTIRSLLGLIAEENRHMKPQQAWYVVIPFFDIYWNFQVAELLANSLTNEFFDRKIAEEPNPGKIFGTLYSWMYLVSYLPIPFLPGFNLIMSMVSFAYFVRYWIRIGEFKALIQEHNRVFGYKKSDNN